MAQCSMSRSVSTNSTSDGCTFRKRSLAQAASLKIPNGSPAGVSEAGGEFAFASAGGDAMTVLGGYEEQIVVGESGR